jgi:uncharacterized protein
MSSNEEKGAFLKVRVIPNASRNEISSFEEGYKIKLKAPPVEGKANKELIAYLSKILKIKKTAIQIRVGDTSRNKTLFIENLSEEVLKKRIWEKIKPA